MRFYLFLISDSLSSLVPPSRPGNADALLLLFFIIIGIEPLRALGADAVGEFRVRMFADVLLKNVPVSLVIPDLLAGCADRQQPAQGLHFLQCVLEVKNELFAFLRSLLALRYVDAVFYYLHHFSRIVKERVPVDLHIPAYAVRVTMRMFDRYRKPGLFDLFQRAGMVPTAARRRAAVRQYMTGQMLRKVAVVRRVICQFQLVARGIDDIKGMGEGIDDGGEEPVLLADLFLRRLEFRDVFDDDDRAHAVFAVEERRDRYLRLPDSPALVPGLRVPVKDRRLFLNGLFKRAPVLAELGTFAEDLVAIPADRVVEGISRQLLGSRVRILDPHIPVHDIDRLAHAVQDRFMDGSKFHGLAYRTFPLIFVTAQVLWSAMGCKNYSSFFCTAVHRVPFDYPLRSFLHFVLLHFFIERGIGYAQGLGGGCLVAGNGLEGRVGGRLFL